MWSLALVANFNNSLSTRENSICQSVLSLPSMHCSASLNYEEEVIENVSYHLT